MALLDDISALLQKGKAKDVAELCQQGIEENMTPKEILENGLMAGMNIIGEKFKKNEVFVPEVLIAARAMNSGLDVLKPLMVGDEQESKGKVILGTVKGDLHDIGKNLVKIMMEGKGLTVIDLGPDVPADKFIETARDEGAQIIALSALLTTTMTEMGNVIKAAEEAGIRDSVKMMVGGAPVTQAFCDSIGADAYADNATSAAQVAMDLCAAMAV